MQHHFVSQTGHCAKGDLTIAGAGVAELLMERVLQIQPDGMDYQ
jgi:hypothetical protein